MRVRVPEDWLDDSAGAQVYEEREARRELEVVQLCTVEPLTLSERDIARDGKGALFAVVRISGRLLGVSGANGVVFPRPLTVTAQFARPAWRQNRR